ncbi:MAG: exonuclease SbcCD subunit D [Clostridiaceae bacterium]
MKFMHISDLHLGSILNIGNNETSFIREIEINGVYDAFNKAVDTAIEKKADFIIISGDIYDRDCYYVRANKIFLDGVEKLRKNNINVYIIHGNHDPLKGMKNLYNTPDNLYVFPYDSPKTFEIKDKEGSVICRIIGQSYEKKEEGKMIYKSFSIPDSSFNIAVLHTSLNINDKKYVPSSVNELSSVKGIDYWALGHIHKGGIVKEENPCIIYPGNPQGRDFGETGVRGCYMVTVTNGKAIPEFIPIGGYIYKEIGIDIRDYNLSNITDIIDVLRGKIDDLLNSAYKPAGYILRWNIKGRGEIHSLLKEGKEDIIKNIIETLNIEYEGHSPFVHTDDIEINTGLDIHVDTESKLYKGMDRVIESINKEAGIRGKMLGSLGSLYDLREDNEDRDDTKIKADNNFIDSILEEARKIIIDKYIERGDSDEI